MVLHNRVELLKRQLDLDAGSRCARHSFVATAEMSRIHGSRVHL